MVSDATDKVWAWTSTTRRSGKRQPASWPHAFNLAKALRSDMDAWWATNPVSLTQELHADGKTIDLVMRTSPDLRRSSWRLGGVVTDEWGQRRDTV